jgi:hypothetical protein
MSTGCSSCALHNLPVGLFATILEKYLEIADWSKLDRAFCSTRSELRNVFLEALKSVKIKSRIVYDTWIWRTINGAQKWITARGIRIVSWEERNLEDKRLTEIVSANNYIESLKLSICGDISDAGITAVAFWLNSNLKELNLAYCYKLTDSSVLAISTGLKNLESLDLTNCGGISDKSFEAIGKSLPKLRKLRVQGTSISDSGIGYITNGCLQNLHELIIAGCENITDDGVVAVAEGNWHNLQTLSVSGCRIRSDLTLKALANGNLSQLRELYIVCTGGVKGGVTDSGLAYFASGNLKNLVTLSIGGDLTGLGLAEIARGMPSLLKLSVFEVLTNADEGLTAIFTHLVNLQELSLYRCDAPDAGLQALIHGETKYALPSLTIRLRYITDDGLKSITNRLTNLKELIICDITGEVTDIGLSSLASSGLQLESLDLSQCDAIREEGIIQVMTKMPTLKSLNISYTAVDTNYYFAYAIAKSCGSSSVRTLEMRGLAVTDIGLMALVYGLRNLVELDCTENDYDFSEEVLDVIREQFPDLLLSH